MSARPTFSGDAKDEIARTRFERACCPASFLHSLAAFSGCQPVVGPTKSVTGLWGVDRRSTSSLAPPHLIVRTERGAVARSALAAAKRSGLRAHSTAQRSRRFRDHTTFSVSAETPPRARFRAPARVCCRRAWLRGAFLACGSVTDPKAGYHLEFFCRSDDAARELLAGLGLLDVDADVARRRGRPLVYVKGAQSLTELLGHMGASRSALALVDFTARRATKNAIQRKVNSEVANAARAAHSGARQRKAALRAVGRVGAPELSAALREAGRLRIAHPEFTLAQLAARARPPITKAAMGYRMRTLERLVAKRVGREHRGPPGARQKL